MAIVPNHRVIPTPHGDLRLPAFLPDATRGVVRGLDARDVEGCGIPALVVNAYHLLKRPGSTTIAALGGIHKVMDWSRPVLTDSGGFQIFSLIRQNPKLGTITNKHAMFRVAGERKTERLSPEKSIQVQLRLGADILICLDDCTHPDDPKTEQAVSVERTIAWARRCKDEFDRGLAAREGKSGRRDKRQARSSEGGSFALSRETVTDHAGEKGPTKAGATGVSVSRETETRRPVLFAVVQGGNDPDLRRRCAEELVALDLDGYCFGGWPFDSQGRFLADTLALTARLLPDDKPKYAMGIGNPASLVACARMGYALFDCALPTRDARRGRLYTFRSASPHDLAFDRVYIRDATHHRDTSPVSTACDCLCCRHYSRAYLHHLFAVGDSLAWRLATIHNLRFYSALMQRLGRPPEAQPTEAPRD